MGRDPEHAHGPTRLGSYEVMRMIARGGMAELFLAQAVGPEGFAKLVVLKKILPQFATSAKFVRLFLDEARLGAALDHPHIAHVYDMGTVDGDYFFTMEYVHGQDVRSIAHRAAEKGLQLPIEHVVLIASTVAGALHYAHEQKGPDGVPLGIVHRDVSPSNILISYDGTVKLVDFGVAKAATSSDKTRTGSIKGKIAYMSPEQASGFPIDRRSDVFSLGIVMWELVTGARLYKEENDLLAIQKIVHSTPQPPSTRRADCPPELERIIMRALAKKPEDRYATTEAMQLELEEFAREQRLAQSSVALRAQIHALFAAELGAWQAAQATGVTLAQHITDHPELTHHLAGDDLEEEIEYPTTAMPQRPTILRPDGTPLPVMQWSAQHPAPRLSSPMITAEPRPRFVSKRSLLVAGTAIGVAIAAIALIGGGKNSGTSETVKMQAAPVEPPAVAPAPVPAPPAEVTAPAPVAETKPAKPPTRKPSQRPARKPTKPAAKPPVKPKEPAFDPNDPLPPRR